jgi:hypothetical protein
VRLKAVICASERPSARDGDMDVVVPVIIDACTPLHGCS